MTYGVVWWLFCLWTCGQLADLSIHSVHFAKRNWKKDQVSQPFTQGLLWNPDSHGQRDPHHTAIGRPLKSRPGSSDTTTKQTKCTALDHLSCDNNGKRMGPRDRHGDLWVHREGGHSWNLEGGRRYRSIALSHPPSSPKERDLILHRDSARTSPEAGAFQYDSAPKSAWVRMIENLLAQEHLLVNWGSRSWQSLLGALLISSWVGGSGNEAVGDGMTLAESGVRRLVRWARQAGSTMRAWDRSRDCTWLKPLLESAGGIKHWSPRDRLAQYSSFHWLPSFTLSLSWSLLSAPQDCCYFSVTKSSLTLWDSRNCCMPGFPVLHHLLEFAQTSVRWVGDAIQPSHPLSSPSPPALNLSQHQGLFQWVGSSHQVAKALELPLQPQSFPWIFRVDFP